VVSGEVSTLVAPSSSTGGTPAPRDPGPNPRLGDSPVIELGDGRRIELFFLVGHPKSGTNWLGALVNLHPDVCCKGEFRFEALRRGFDTLERQWWHAAHAGPTRDEAERCFRESVVRIMLASAHDSPRATRIGDRTPRALAPYIPGARQLYMLRDPRDVLVSWTFQEIREWGVNVSAPIHAAAMRPLHESFRSDPEFFSKHPERLLGHEGWVRFVAKRYAAHVSADLDLIDRAREGRIDLPVHVVRYERLHADLDREFPAVLAFLGLDPSLAAPPRRESRTLPGFGAENSMSFFRKGTVGDWRIHFTDQTRAWFKGEAQAMLERLAYERSTNW
jgi:Sulfotransferase domain